LLAGTWIGCDDRFIHIESAQGMGGSAARPIWQAFFKKVYADKSLGIDRDAEFSKPADMQNAINDADIMRAIDNIPPDAPADNGNNANDYSLDTSNSYMPPESQLPVDEEKAVKKDKPKKDSAKAQKIGDMAPQEKKEKKGFFKRLFGGKDKDKAENDY
jgi:penicillin-binding protein 1A